MYEWKGKSHLYDYGCALTYASFKIIETIQIQMSFVTSTLADVVTITNTLRLIMPCVFYFHVIFLSTIDKKFIVKKNTSKIFIFRKLYNCCSKRCMCARLYICVCIHIKIILMLIVEIKKKMKINSSLEETDSETL